MKISVIIPLFNAGNFIAECLDSVLAQQPLPFEIICVDDCSSDNGPQIVEEYARKHGGLIRLVRLEKNQGAPVARNTGIKMATGDYIQLLDADDVLLPGKLEHQTQLIQKSSSPPDFIAAAYIRRAADGKEKQITVATGDLWLALLKAGLGCTCSNLWKREALNAIGGFSEQLKSSQEYDLMFRLLKNGAKVLLDQTPLTVAITRPIGKSISQRDPSANWLRYISLRAETLAYLDEQKKIADLSYYQPLFEAIKILYAYDAAKSLEFHKKYIPKAFRPVASPAVSKSYCSIYAWVGFRWAEKLKKLLGK